MLTIQVISQWYQGHWIPTFLINSDHSHGHKKKNYISFKLIKRVIFIFCFLQVSLAAVLVLAGTELNFLSSLESAMLWVCAGSRAGNSKIFSVLVGTAYTESKPFLLLTSSHQPGGWGCMRSWEVTVSTADAHWPKRYFRQHSAMSAVRTVGKEKEWGKLRATLFSHVAIIQDKGLSSWRWLNICRPMGRSWCLV